MAFFDDNQIGSMGSVTVEAAEGYSGAIGAQLAMVEGFQNDFAMFSAALKTDIKETKMVREGAGEEEIGALQEGALGNFWAKIKAFIMKVIAKVKGIFQGFIAKFEAWMNRDGRAFYNKYKKEIFSGKDLDGLKVRYSKPKLDVTSITVDITKAAPDGDVPEGKTQSDLAEEYLGVITHPAVKADKKDFRKDFHEACFEDEDKTYEVKSGNVADIVKYISGKSDPIEAIRKISAAQEKGLNAYLKQIEKYAGKATDYAVDGTKRDHDIPAGRFDGGDVDDKGNKTGYKPAAGKFNGGAAAAQKHAAGLQKEASAMQEALGIANSAILTEIKFAVAQSRRVAAAIVAFNPKKHEDTSLLVEMEQDAAEYEVMSALEAVC